MYKAREYRLNKRERERCNLSLQKEKELQGGMVEQLEMCLTSRVVCLFALRLAHKCGEELGRNEGEEQRKGCAQSVRDPKGRSQTKEGDWQRAGIRQRAPTTERGMKRRIMINRRYSSGSSFLHRLAIYPDVAGYGLNSVWPNLQFESASLTSQSCAGIFL